MTDSQPKPPDPPWLAAWLAAQEEMSRHMRNASPAAPDTVFALQRLLGFGGDFAELAAQATRLAARPGEPAGALAQLTEGYRRLLAPRLATVVTPAGTGPAWSRWERAMRALTPVLAGIATDAASRFTREMAREGPEAPPITSLRELFELWIDCGESAWAAAAHREQFAEAQAELLAALVELRRAQASS